MTVQEAIELHLKPLKERAFAHTTEKALDMAIQALEEVEQYRALGTVEGFQKALDSSLEYYNQMKEYKAKLQEYEAIGTVEELKEAREKQVAKKPNVYPFYGGKCSVCNNVIPNKSVKYCSKCGQALKWGEEDD